MRIFMHDSESETFVLKSVPEKFSDKLKEIDVTSTPKEIATDDVESDNYYSRVFAQTTIMVTNKGCLEVKGKNIDVIQILQKG
tara:strand:- start:137 stop:385 length:249 start_codon:yes stop_codon:yes gene_type:complete